MRQYFTVDHNKNEIVNLRKLAFSDKFMDKVNLEGLNWNNTDENSTHLCFRTEQQLLSTLRITQYTTQEKFDKATQIPWINNIDPPFLLLARAATHTDLQKSDIHAKLRVLALEICLQYNIKKIFGSLQKKSQRLEHLLSLGYVVLESRDRWAESYIQSDGDVVLICLDGTEKIANFIQSERKRLNFNEILILSGVDLKKY